MTYLDELARPVRAKLLVYAEDVRAERHTGQRGYWDDDAWHVYGGASANGERAAMEYTERDRARVNAILRASGVRVSVDDSEGVLQQALAAFDAGERATVSVMATAERMRDYRAGLPEGRCIVACGRMARPGKATCEPCNDAAKARVKASRERARAKN